MVVGFCFTEKEYVYSYEDVAESDEQLFKKFFHGMLDNGVYLAPSMYEAGFVSSAHSKQEVIKTQMAAEKVLSQLIAKS